MSEEKGKVIKLHPDVDNYKAQSLDTLLSSESFQQFRKSREMIEAETIHQARALINSLEVHGVIDKDGNVNYDVQNEPGKAREIAKTALENRIKMIKGAENLSEFDKNALLKERMGMSTYDFITQYIQLGSNYTFDQHMAIVGNHIRRKGQEITQYHAQEIPMDDLRKVYGNIQDVGETERIRIASDTLSQAYEAHKQAEDIRKRYKMRDAA